MKYVTICYDAKINFIGKSAITYSCSELEISPMKEENFFTQRFRTIHSVSSET